MSEAQRIADYLESIHWDGNGCGTHGTSACSNCFGPSPMTAREIAEAVLDFQKEVEIKLPRLAGSRKLAEELVRKAGDLSDKRVVVNTRELKSAPPSFVEELYTQIAMQGPASIKFRPGVVGFIDESVD